MRIFTDISDEQLGNILSGGVNVIAADIGDGECAAAVFDHVSGMPVPLVIENGDKHSVATAIFVPADGTECAIGDAAVAKSRSGIAGNFYTGFKCMPEDAGENAGIPDVACHCKPAAKSEVMRLFVQRFVDELFRLNDGLLKHENPTALLVGRPSSERWQLAQHEYKRILGQGLSAAGKPIEHLFVVSESASALANVAHRGDSAEASFDDIVDCFDSGSATLNYYRVSRGQIIDEHSWNLGAGRIEHAMIERRLERYRRETGNQEKLFIDALSPYNMRQAKERYFGIEPGQPPQRQIAELSITYGAPTRFPIDGDTVLRARKQAEATPADDAAFLRLPFAEACLARLFREQDDADKLRRNDAPANIIYNRFPMAESEAYTPPAPRFEQGALKNAGVDAEVLSAASRRMNVANALFEGLLRRSDTSGQPIIHEGRVMNRDEVLYALFVIAGQDSGGDVTLRISRSEYLSVSVDEDFMREVAHEMPVAFIDKSEPLGIAMQPSFSAAHLAFFRMAKERGGKTPDRVILFGGGSRMPFMRESADEVYKSSVIEDAAANFNVAGGLARMAQRELETERMYRSMLGNLPGIASGCLDEDDEAGISTLADKLSDLMAESLLDNVIAPVMKQWKDKELGTLYDAVAAINRQGKELFSSEDYLKRVKTAAERWFDTAKRQIVVCVNQEIDRALSCQMPLSYQLELPSHAYQPVLEAIENLKIDINAQNLLNRFTGAFGWSMARFDYNHPDDERDDLYNHFMDVNPFGLLYGFKPATQNERVEGLVPVYRENLIKSVNELVRPALVSAIVDDIGDLIGSKLDSLSLYAQTHKE